MRAGGWGGAGISLIVTDAGATAQLDCAHTVFPQALRSGADGYFISEGSHTLEGGLEPVGGRPTYPASVRGAFDGDSMELTLTYAGPDGQAVSGSFRLAYGAAPVLNRCP